MTSQAFIKELQEIRASYTAAHVTKDLEALNNTNDYVHRLVIKLIEGGV